MRARAFARAGWLGGLGQRTRRYAPRSRRHFGESGREDCHQRPAQPTLALLGNGPLAPVSQARHGRGPPGKAIGQVPPTRGTRRSPPDGIMVGRRAPVTTALGRGENGARPRVRGGGRASARLLGERIYARTSIRARWVAGWAWPAYQAVRAPLASPFWRKRAGGLPSAPRPAHPGAAGKWALSPRFSGATRARPARQGYRAGAPHARDQEVPARRHNGRSARARHHGVGAWRKRRASEGAGWGSC